MIPLLVMLVGLAVCALCVWLLSKTGRAYLKKLFRRAIEEDRRTFGSDETIE